WMSCAAWARELYTSTISTLLLRRVPRATPNPTLFPYTTLFRSAWHKPEQIRSGRVNGTEWNCNFIPGTNNSASRSSKVFNFEERSEEHTSELQSQSNLVCRLLLEKKKARRTMRKWWRRMLRGRP